MEAAIIALVFILILLANVVLSARAGLAEDAQWSRQQALTCHGVLLGLAASDRAARRPDLLDPPRESERLPAAVTPPDPDRRAWRAAAPAAAGTQVFVPDGYA